MLRDIRTCLVRQNVDRQNNSRPRQSTANDYYGAYTNSSHRFPPRARTRQQTDRQTDRQTNTHTHKVTDATDYPNHGWLKYGRKFQTVRPATDWAETMTLDAQDLTSWPMGIILGGEGDLDPPILEWGNGLPLNESIKSENLPSKRVMQKCRVPTVM